MEGIKLLYDYITPAEEAEIMAQLPKIQVIKTGERRNSIMRYGSNLPYKGKMVDSEIPAYLQAMCEKLVADGVTEVLPDSVTINDYKPGQGIDFHIDSKTSGSVIIVLSLLGRAEMVLRKKGKKQQTLFNIPARTLVVMEGEARTDYEHAIIPVLNERISIVFRKGTPL